jgi:DNA-directed RNA polymerase specialized sigma24 family protein
VPEDAPRRLPDELLARMRAGDREAAAEFMVIYGARFRRRLRSLVGRAVRRSADEDDLFATVTRRLDELVLRHRLRAATVEELWSLVGRIAVNAAADAAHVTTRERVAGTMARAGAPNQAVSEVRKAETDEEARAALRRSRAVLGAIDQDILRLRIAGRTFGQIARALGRGCAAVRKRWERIRKALRADAPGSGGISGSPKRKRSGSTRRRRS